MSEDAPFSRAMSLTPEGPCRYRADIPAEWSIGDKVHGGVMLALCAQAAREAMAASAVGAGGDAAVYALQPSIVSANYLSAPDPGAVVLEVTPRKHGRRVGLADVELVQDGRTAVHAVVTLTEPETGPPLHAARPGPAAMPPEPADDALDVRTHPAGAIINLAKVCDVRWDPSGLDFLAPQSAGRAAGVPPEGPLTMRLWARPRGEDPGALFALMSGDLSAPVTLHLGRHGWAPTIQLTTYLRARPRPGWLRIEATGTLVGSTWFEEDHLVLDQDGTVVVQSRQLAMVPGA